MNGNGNPGAICKETPRAKSFVESSPEDLRVSRETLADLQRRFYGYTRGTEKYSEPDLLAKVQLVLYHDLVKFTLTQKEGELKYFGTLLHLSVIEDFDDISIYLIKKAPKLIFRERTGNDSRGQTPFHFAIAKSKEKLVEIMLELVKETSEYKDILSKTAEGPEVHGTVLMGGVPLSIAALTGNENIIGCLINSTKERICMNVDNLGSSVIHAIISWGHWTSATSKSMIGILDTFKSLLEKDEFRCLMYYRNKEGLTPLQLTVKTGQYELFQHLMSLEDIFVFKHRILFLNDICYIDITDIITRTWTLKTDKCCKPCCMPIAFKQNNMKGEIDFKHDASDKKIQERLYQTTPVLEAIFSHSVKQSMRFVSNDVIDEIICKKWRRYRAFFYTFSIIHLSLMCLLSSVGVFRNYVVKKVSSTAQLKYVNVATGLSLAFGNFYATQEIVRSFVLFQPLFWGKFHHNFIYCISFCGFGLFLIMDSVWNFAKNQESNYFLYIALCLGWFSCLFFLRGNCHTSFYSYMFLTCVFGEVMFFVPVMIPLCMPFPVAMHEAFFDSGGPTANDTANSTIPGF